VTTSKVAVVFGGTSGIGLATAAELVGQGHRVAICGRDPGRGEGAARELGGDTLFVAGDVARGADVARVVDAVVARWGRLDVAVNAAVLDELRPAPTAEITEQEWNRTIAVDVTGVWLCMRSEITAMLAAGGGAIVNVSSVNGLSGTPMAAAYCAAKHALHGLSKTAAIEYAPRGIRVNVVCPGAHRTRLLEKVFATAAPDDPARAEAMYKTLIPAGRIGEPPECGRTIAWLLSDAASYVTGAVVTVDGGMSAS
jgi:NAD(P)-dependent dehydrogenase (short-subunit alcohol dehydrogenase family)